jgi:hypothetical protein
MTGLTGGKPLSAVRKQTFTIHGIKGISGLKNNWRQIHVIFDFIYILQFQLVFPPIILKN